MTNIKEISTGEIYPLIRYENMWNPPNQQFVVNDGGEEKIIPVTDGKAL